MRGISGTCTRMYRDEIIIGHTSQALAQGGGRGGGRGFLVHVHV